MQAANKHCVDHYFINMHFQLTSRVFCLNVGDTGYLLPSLLYKRNKGTGKSTCLYRSVCILVIVLGSKILFNLIISKYKQKAYMDIPLHLETHNRIL